MYEYFGALDRSNISGFSFDTSVLIAVAVLILLLTSVVENSERPYAVIVICPLSTLPNRSKVPLF